jgi:PAS domain S-box-containing protein
MNALHPSTLLAASAVPSPVVWVLEDSPTETEALRRTLANSCRVETFLDGAELIEALSRQPPPSVLVLDWALPGMSGIEVCQYLRGNPSTASLPILLLTGNQTPEDVAQGLSAGANDYVFKPYRPLELTARVQALVRWDAQRKQALVDERARLLDLSDDAILIRDLEDRIVFWSQGAERLYGWTRQEALGQVTHTLFQTRAADSLAEAQAALRAHGRWEGELLHTTKSGGEVVVASRWALHRDAAGRATGTLELGTNITQRKRAQQRTERLQAAISALSTALTPEEVARAVLTEAMAALGASAGLVYQLQPDGLLHLVHGTGYEESRLHAFRTLAPDAPQPAAAVLHTGEPIWLESVEALRACYPHLAPLQPFHNHQAWASAPMRVNDRAVGAFVLAFGQPRALDAEDRAFLVALAQKCGQCLERARLFREAQAAVRLRDEFLSVASHELRTPLTPLHLQLQILRREARDPALPPERLRERVTRAVERSEAQVRKLADLINDLLDVSRISAGRLVLEPESVDLAEVVRDVVARFEPQALRAGCALELDVPAALMGHWDRRRVEQVVTNLLTNALKYGAGRPVRLSLAAEEGHARLTVRDEGIGIAPEHQTRIFERFERAVSERNFGGMGLGLYICQQILDAQGGTIRVRSALGQGATFEVLLPTAPSLAVSVALQPQPGADGGHHLGR